MMEPKQKTRLVDFMAVFATSTAVFFRDYMGEHYFGPRHLIGGLFAGIVLYAFGTYFEGGPRAPLFGVYVFAYVGLGLFHMARRRAAEGRGVWINPHYSGRSFWFKKSIEDVVAKKREPFLRAFLGLFLFYYVDQPTGVVFTISAIAERFCQMHVLEYRRRMARDIIGNQEWQEGLLGEVARMQQQR